MCLPTDLVHAVFCNTNIHVFGHILTTKKIYGPHQSDINMKYFCRKLEKNSITDTHTTKNSHN